MTHEPNRHHVQIDDAGRVVAAAEVERLEESGVVRADLRVESGHHPTGSGGRLVDAVLDRPEVQGAAELQAAVPLGEAEIVERLRERCDDVRTRPAGATLLVDARLPQQPPAAVEPPAPVPTPPLAEPTAS